MVAVKEPEKEGYIPCPTKPELVKKPVGENKLVKLPVFQPSPC